MKPASAKAKGRKLQQHVRDRVLDTFPDLQPGDVRSTSMGASGADVQLSPAALNLFPFAVETKCQEKLNIWDALEQAHAHSQNGEGAPLLVFKRNRSEVYAALPFEDLLILLTGARVRLR
ncbi:MAG: hypothetical protein AB7R40_23175 [Nitrospiraceae bacterium]